MTKNCPSCYSTGENDEGHPCMRCFGSGELETYTGRVRGSRPTAEDIDQLALDVE